MSATTQRRRGGRRGRTPPRPYAAFNPAWQCTTGDMLTRVALTPSRQKLPKPFPRKDLAENLANLNDALWRNVHATRNMYICTTRRQLARACGLPMDRSAASLAVVTGRWTKLYEEAGLIKVITGKDDLNMDARLEILVLEPPELPEQSRYRGVATAVCEARRRRETRAQRASRREKPWCRTGGRGRQTYRWDFSFGEQLLIPESLPSAAALKGPPRAGQAITATPGLGRSTQEPSPTQRGRARETRAGARTAERQRRGSDAIGAPVPPRLRWAALNRLRTAITEETGFERLRRAALDGAPPCSVAAVAFEGRFLSDGPWSWWHVGDFHEPAVIGTHRRDAPPSQRQLAESDPELFGVVPPRHSYRLIGARWATRLERYCAAHDRRTGRRGSGLLSLLDDIWSWQPEDGAQAGWRYHGAEFGWPCTLAWFIARLGQRRNQLRQTHDERRRRNAWAWLDDQDAGRISRRPEPLSDRRRDELEWGLA